MPREMWPTMFDWTNRVIGSADPEYQEAGDDAFRTAQKARLALFGYFAEMARARRGQPGDDIVSIVANAHIDGEPLPERELLSFYFLLVVIYPRGMGLGDVKLAGVLGLVLGWLGWGELAVGGFLGFLFGAVVGGLLMLVRKAGRKTKIPFGPFMIVGALIAVLWGGELWDLYVQTLT